MRADLFFSKTVHAQLIYKHLISFQLAHLQKNRCFILSYNGLSVEPFGHLGIFFIFFSGRQQSTVSDFKSFLLQKKK